MPEWKTFRAMGAYLIRPKCFVAILANHVGGGISEDQIYSYFSTNRRCPDGEFALRLREFIALLRNMNEHLSLGPKVARYPGWYDVKSALEIEIDAGNMRVEATRRQMSLYRRTRSWLPEATPELIFKRMAAKRR